MASRGGRGGVWLGGGGTPHPRGEGTPDPSDPQGGVPLAFSSGIFAVAWSGVPPRGGSGGPEGSGNPCMWRNGGLFSCHWSNVESVYLETDPSVVNSSDTH